ncbi:FAD-dependent oxidoreductase [Ideonella sp. BN130291]|uniref:FAD-dependent oxidoreductase n=1 Tax=Ideonella sp. BN130291 TaxID=3112940 RepID=UPI002E2605AF|nr:FAD-dependent oxidoreductase [Ideonella sp. BN130291]
MKLTRRAVMLAAASLSACGQAQPAGWTGGWVGADAARGHRLRSLSKSGNLPAPAVQRKAHVLVLGAGIAGLAAARALAQRGIDDVHLLELEDVAGGNSRGHVLAGMACPLGAHYLPLPGPHAHEVGELLHELGLLRMEAGRVVPDEMHLCHSPQERLFIDGAWVDGLLPPAEPGSGTLAQYRRFAALVAQAQRELGFAMPTERAGWTAGHAALDAQTFAQWLDGQGLRDTRLRWYLDYCCRDDYGAGSAVVSAWAGLHYFASRHGFHAPGDEDAERDPVFTWPEGNAWLARRLAAPLAGRLHTGRTVLRVSEGRHAVQVWAHDEAQGHIEAWTAHQVVLALPLFIAARVLNAPPAALMQSAQQQPHAPWLVANLHLAEPLLDRLGGAPPSWDNVCYAADPRSLGYVDAMHQSTRPHPGPTVLSAYWALPQAERGALLSGDWRLWAERVVADLATAHPDLPGKLRHADLMRYGHAMSIPVPGLRGSPALAALREPIGRLHFAHADLAGYSVFEEAFSSGTAVGRRIAAAQRLG